MKIHTTIQITRQNILIRNNRTSCLTNLRANFKLDQKNSQNTILICDARDNKLILARTTTEIDKKYVAL